MNTVCTEIIESIATYCSQSSLHALTLTNKRLYEICKPALYKENAQSGRSSAIFYSFFGSNIDEDMVLGILQAAREAGADVNIPHLCPQSTVHRLNGILKPLQVALAYRYYRVIDMMLREGAHAAEEDICWALGKGLDVGAAQMIQFLDDQGSPVKPIVLHWAVAHHQRISTRLLLDAGYDINGLDEEDYTPIQAAVQHPGDVAETGSFLSWLIRLGADVNQSTIHGTALSLACAIGRFDIANKLVSRGARIVARDFGDFNKNEVNNRYGLYETGLWRSQDDIHHCSDSAVTWSKWLLSLQPVIDITPRSPATEKPLRALVNDGDEEDEFFVGEPGPHTFTGTPIDLLLDSSLCAMLSTKHGNAEAATMLLKAGCRVPSLAFRSIAEALGIISATSYTTVDIRKRWPTLLDVLPLLLERHPPMLSALFGDNFFSGVANILRAFEAELYQGKARKREGQSESKPLKRIRIQKLDIDD